jgi:thiol:disulfide interchange protein
MIETSTAKEIQMAVLKKLKSMPAAALLAVLTVCASVAAMPHAGAQMAPPAVKKHLYPDIGAAQHDIDAALVEAKRTHKRILLDFGGDWCGDCQVLDIYFNQAPNAELLAKNFIKVNINIGRMDANLDIAHKYGVPVHGVPALAVIDANGRVITSQDLQFADMRNMQPSSVTDFLNKWKR